MAGDGQMTLGGSVVMKNNTKKIRKVGSGDILVGFAGSTSDSMILIERLEGCLAKNENKLIKSCVDLAKYWRSEKYMRNLEAMMIVADKNDIFLLSGSGDVIEPENSVVAIGSGGQFAYSAGLAMYKECPKLTAQEIAKKSIEIAGQICVFTNLNIVMEFVE